MTRTRTGRFVDEPFPNLCDWVAHPDVPSPAGGTVVAACSALAASLAELILRVTKNRLDKKGERTERVDELLTEAAALRVRLLDYGEGDVYEAQKIIQGERNACVRKDVGSPAKIAGTIVKVLRLGNELAPMVGIALHSDVRVIAYLAHAGVMGITEICYANIRLAGGADDELMARIERWRTEAAELRDSILSRTT
ncbi:formiminotetrahydrofolate cyclodeaminase [Tumebacillus sp. BK434]|uniref:cyclodeaminase/cyclohydrolase family protein n=1 Tax=Tumebacillus sp. BK434 TaxID=2512169 RepID=UPI0010501424|nr:cyclodeaminase/cyclohydrolase family protein [Tumebacillus sp. BK434]TCP58127.1 formiminotetrahydrofolate cyclodeaminase [Tumebacillus sp. BK434]